MTRNGENRNESTTRIQPMRNIESRPTLQLANGTRTAAVMTNAIQIEVTDCWNSSDVAFGKLERLARAAATDQAEGDTAAAREKELALWHLLRPSAMKTARSGVAGDPGAMGGRVVNGGLRLALQALQLEQRPELLLTVPR